MFTHSLIKKLSCICLLLFSFGANAQQVKKIDCCKDVSPKATIIINNGTDGNGTSAVVSTSPTNGIFNFELKSNLNTSAGVYNADGVLVRTLWGGVRYDAGCYEAQWDGLLDDGTTQAPFGNYTIKILTNNVQYTWEGGIGNTSNRAKINKGFSGIASGGLAATNTVVAYGESFSEGESGSKVFLASDINNVNYLDNTTRLINIAVCTDGVNFYWAGRDDYVSRHSNQSLNAIFATKVSDNSPVQFSSGVTYNTGQSNNPYNYFIGAFAANDQSYSDLTVQANGNLLIASSSQTGYISFFYKTSGALIRQQTLGKPENIAAGTNNELWAYDSQTKVITKYSIDANRNLTSTGITISGLTGVQSIKISPDDATLAVLDASTQQVKFYSNATGALTSTFGQLNGYAANGPLVQTDKFAFGNNAQFAYQPNGSFWVVDDNLALLSHFSANRQFIEQSMYVPASRCVAADPNDPSRVFSDLREYKVDYSKPLDNGTNGSWKLYKYWGANAPDVQGYGGFIRVVTLPNGFTYGKGQGTNIFVLDNAIGTRLVNSNVYGVLEADGSLWSRYGDNTYLAVHKSSLISTGIDGKLIWGNDVITAKTPAYTSNSPWFVLNTNNVTGNITNSNRYFFFNPWFGRAVNLDVGLGYHFGGINVGSDVWNFQTSKSTYKDYYGGDYPRNGDFDIGNNDYDSGSRSVDCQALVQEKNIFWHVNAEFWRTNYIANNGVNIWNHFNEDGLLVGNFGVTSSEARSFLGNAGNAGNSFSTALVKVGPDYYIFHCDESQWGWAHRWKISGLSTITEQSISLTVSQGVAIAANPADMMAGLPFRSNNFTGNDRWIIRYPIGGTMSTGGTTYKKNDNDIAIGGNGKQVLDCDLKNSSSLSSWSLSGMMNFGLQGQAKTGDDNYNYLEILDANGKIIARYSDEVDTRNNYYHRTYSNDVLIKEGNDYPVAQLDNKLFEFKYVGGILSFKYQYYNKGEIIIKTIPKVWENGAIMSTPAYLRVDQGGNGNQNHVMDLSKITFTTN